MGARTRRATKVRAATEFDMRRLALELMPPKDNAAAYSWTLADIVTARDEQLRGQFKLPARMAASMRTDDAIHVAYENRLAPQRCIPVELVPAKGARGAGIAGEADALFGQNGIGIQPGTAADINGCLVNHGVAFAACTATTREDGSRIDYAVKSWPIEFVRWDPTDGVFKTQTAEGPDETIVHGDGRWVVFQKHEIRPFQQEAAILAAALVWARHSLALRDWARGSVSHGNAKYVGEMPLGMSLQGDGGGLSKDAAAFLELLKALASWEVPIGIRPAGSKTELITNNSTAWQVWKELVLNGEAAAARIYLGTDGILGSKGGSPGVDVQALFGVAATKVEGDLTCIQRGFLTGVIEPWAALNFGDSALAPMRRYMLPDADDDARRASTGARRSAFFADIAAARENGFEVTQDYVEKVAKVYEIEPPTLLTKPAPTNALDAAATV